MKQFFDFRKQVDEFNSPTYAKEYHPGICLENGCFADVLEDAKQKAIAMFGTSEYDKLNAMGKEWVKERLIEHAEHIHRGKKGPLYNEDDKIVGCHNGVAQTLAQKRAIDERRLEEKLSQKAAEAARIGYITVPQVVQQMAAAPRKRARSKGKFVRVAQSQEVSNG